MPFSQQESVMRLTKIPLLLILLASLGLAEEGMFPMS